AFNAEYDPPYFVMPFYEDGDLATQRLKVASSSQAQERLCCKMIDCIAELHSTGLYHRDIKPANVLLDGDDLVVSDLGLATDTHDATTLTSTAEAWGTLGYTPPEARLDGFREPDAAYDIFMIGKAMYNVLTGRDPLYMTPDG